MKELTVFLLFAGFMLLPAAKAMPTDADIQKVRPILKALTDGDYAALKEGKITRSELADAMLGYVGDAESEAAKFSLIQAAFKNYMNVYEAEKAVKAFDMLDTGVKDVPRGTFGSWCAPHIAQFAKNGRADALAVLLNKSLDSGDSKSTSELMNALRPYQRKLGGGAKVAATPFAAAFERATRQERRERETAMLRAAIRKSPDDASLHERYALALSASGDWDAALKEFALSAGSIAEAAAWERKWPNVGKSSWTPAKAADLWWDRAAATKDEDAAAVLRERSVAWYEIAINQKELTGLRKTIAEKRIKEAEQSRDGATAPVVAATRLGRTGGSVAGKSIKLNIGNGVDMELMPCPAGKFTMGFEGANSMHAPHKVTISRPFWAGKFPVTRAQWNELMPAKSMNEMETALGGLNGAVTDVSRVDIAEYCAKLNEKFGKQLPKGYVFRLPTLAEQEYVFRANSKLDSSPFGKPRGVPRQELDEIGVGNEGKQEMLRRKNVQWKEDTWRVPAQNPSVAVGLRKPNPWGLYDLIGNIDLFVMDVAPSSRTTFVTHVNDLAWADCIDPLFWCDEGIDGSAMFIKAHLSQPWGDLMKLYAQTGRHWRCLGFRIVAAPDLLAERNLKLRRL